LSAVPPRGLQPGLTIGHYAVVSRLGQGGMGEVFLARDTHLGRHVALKVLSREFVGDREHLQRFQREARHLAGLSHPNIVTVFAVEEIEGHHFLSMEYVDGHTLRSLVVPSGLEVERFLEIAVALTDAVAAAHERGVTHRDLKPENVMVSGSGRLKVLDFGLAKVRAGSRVQEPTQEGETLTRQGVLLGTVPYMSPEQLDGGDADHRSDLFSLGIMLYELLTGERPFNGDTSARLVTAILRDEPPSLHDARPDVPPALARLVHRCLHKDPTLRPQSASEMCHELQELLQAQRFGRIDVASRRRLLRNARVPIMQTMAALSSLRTRAGLTMLLAALMAFNWIETSAETALRLNFGLGQAMGYELAGVMSWMEQGLTFERHDLTNPVGIYAASLAYFALPVLLAVGTAWRLAAQPSIAPYRVFTFSIVITYALSLGCFLFFPVPERWAYPDSEAVLLSDLWTTALIDALRPISGLDNSFPSFHVSSAIDFALLWYVYRLRFRHAVAFLTAAVILSTFVLGIHWLPDIAAGAALGVVSVWLAVRLNRGAAGADPDPLMTSSWPRGYLSPAPSPDAVRS
jgi:membrane-associated phospholipid phosphatase/predicted Ser/Thr protein kinase